MVAALGIPRVELFRVILLVLVVEFVVVIVQLPGLELLKLILDR